MIHSLCLSPAYGAPGFIQCCGAVFQVLRLRGTFSLSAQHTSMLRPRYPGNWQMNKLRRRAAGLEQVAGIVRLWCHGTDGAGDHDVFPLFRVRVVVESIKMSRTRWGKGVARERETAARGDVGWRLDCIGEDFVLRSNVHGITSRAESQTEFRRAVDDGRVRPCESAFAKWWRYEMAGLTHDHQLRNPGPRHESGGIPQNANCDRWHFLWCRHGAPPGGSIHATESGASGG